jgi:hypothetical protein
MAILVQLDRLLLERRMSLTELPSGSAPLTPCAAPSTASPAT